MIHSYHFSQLALPQLCFTLSNLFEGVAIHLPLSAQHALMQERRRQVLQWLTVGAANACLSASALSLSRLNVEPFSLGVASGSPTFESVVLWTRLYAAGPSAVNPGNAAITVRWEVAHDEYFQRPVRSGQATAIRELAYSVHVEVAGLEPDRWYFYRFMLGDAVSTVGRTRTFPKPDAVVKRLRVSYASCQKWEDGYFSAWRHMRQEDLDAVVFLGDYIYEYPGTSSKLRHPGGWVLTLDDYRRRYALYRSDHDLQSMHATCPWLITWDDHEVQNDYAGQHAGHSGASDPSIGSDFLLRRAAAYQAWYEHMPVRSVVLTQGLAGLLRGAEMRIYQRLEFGSLASVYLLDTRQYRDPQICNKDDGPGSSRVNPDSCAGWSDPGRSLLGLQQEEWLYRQFAAQRSREVSWNIIGQQTLVGERNFRTGSGRLLWNDGWDGYTSARSRLTNSFREHLVRNPVVLGGDIHENWVGHIKADYSKPDGANVAVEFCGTSITSRSGGNGKTAERLAANPHFVFAEAQARGYGVVEFAPRQLSTTLRVLDDVTRQDSTIATLAHFTVRVERPVVERD